MIHLRSVLADLRIGEVLKRNVSESSSSVAAIVLHSLKE